MMGLDKKKKEINEEKLRQRLLSERESRRIAQRFESLEKEVHRLLTRGGSVDLQEALDRPSVAVPLTPPPPPPPPWSDEDNTMPSSPEHYKEAAQWNYASSLEGQRGAINTGTYSTPVPETGLWTLLRAYGGVIPGQDDQVTPRDSLPMTLDITGMSYMPLDLAENVGHSDFIIDFDPKTLLSLCDQIQCVIF